jgi:transposase
MLTLPPSVKIWLATEPIDMRKGYDGLIGVVQTEWAKDPYAGHLFAFVGRRRDRIKILFWDRGGFVLYCKRLEKGRFQIPEVRAGQRSVTLEGTQLSMLLSGFDLNVERLRRWSPPSAAIDTAAKM